MLSFVFTDCPYDRVPPTGEDALSTKFIKMWWCQEKLLLIWLTSGFLIKHLLQVLEDRSVFFFKSKIVLMTAPKTCLAPLQELIIKKGWGWGWGGGTGKRKHSTATHNDMLNCAAYMIS